MEIDEFFDLADHSYVSKESYDDHCLVHVVTGQLARAEMIIKKGGKAVNDDSLPAMSTIIALWLCHPTLKLNESISGYIVRTGLLHLLNIGPADGTRLDSCAATDQYLKREIDGLYGSKINFVCGDIFGQEMALFVDAMKKYVEPR